MDTPSGIVYYNFEDIRYELIDLIVEKSIQKWLEQHDIKPEELAFINPSRLAKHFENIVEYDLFAFDVWWIVEDIKKNYPDVYEDFPGLREYEKDTETVIYQFEFSKTCQERGIVLP